MSIAGDPNIKFIGTISAPAQLAYLVDLVIEGKIGSRRISCLETAFDRLVDLLKYSEELHMLKRLWNDEGGAIISAELVLVATILVIGMIVGLKSVRDAVVTELADVGQAISAINQSYRYGGVTGHFAQTMGSNFQDLYDFCDTGDSLPGQSSRCTAFDPGTGVGETTPI